VIYPRPFVVATPYTRVGASEGYIQSLANFMAHHGASTEYRVFAGSSYGKNRNLAVDWFMRETEAEWLLQLDDDIRFPKDIVQRLASIAPEDARVIIGSVPIDFSIPNVFASDSLGRSVGAVTAEKAGSLVSRVQAFGGAVMLVHREVYLHMAEAFGWGSWYAMWQEMLPVAETGELATILELEPDLSFGRRLREIKVDAWAIHGIPLTHSKPVELKSSTVVTETTPAR
jgi:hypothetical protein